MPRALYWCALAVAACAINSVLSIYAIPLFDGVFGHEWRHHMRQWALDIGWPMSGLGWVAFAQLQLPQWLALAALTYTLGLVKRRVAHEFAWLLALTMPVADILAYVGVMWFYTVSPYDFDTYSTVLSVQIRIVSLLAIPIGLLSWLLGYQIRGKPRGPKIQDGRYTRCIQCDYDLRASTGSRCPECGAAIEAPSSANHQTT